MKQIKLSIILLLMLISMSATYAQPLYRFSVKVGIDKETVEALGGEKAVREKCAKLFTRVNKAFNNDQLEGLYDFYVDWDAFYIYDGPSDVEVFKAHPDHDYQVIMDGLKNHPSEHGGGWYGREIQAIYHSRLSRIHSVSDPFDGPKATDAIVHEFGHSRGMPDIYAMKVDAAKNPINHQPFTGISCRMNGCYGVTRWSDYAVNIFNFTANRVVEGDNVVKNAFPKSVKILVVDEQNRPVKDAEVKLYPVGWYSYTVSEKFTFNGKTDKKGEYLLPGNPYGLSTPKLVDSPNVLVEATLNGKKTYAWMPIYLVQSAYYKNQPEYTLKLSFKGSSERVKNIFEMYDTYSY